MNRMIKNIIIVIIGFLSVGGLFANVAPKKAAKKRPTNKQQIHFYNKYGSDIVVQATWRKRNGLASPGVPKNKEAHPTRITDFTVKKGKSIMVKAPIFGYDLELFSAQNAGQVAQEVGMAVGSAIIVGVSLGTASAAVGAADAAATAADAAATIATEESAALEAAIVEAGYDSSLVDTDILIDSLNADIDAQYTANVSAAATANAVKAGAVAGTIIAGTGAATGTAGAKIAIRTGKARADGFTYFTFVPAKGKKVNKKNPPVMIVCAKMAPNKK